MARKPLSRAPSFAELVATGQLEAPNWTSGDPHQIPLFEGEGPRAPEQAGLFAPDFLSDKIIAAARGTASSTRGRARRGAR